ncbi:MAG: hypothetical protein KAS23_11790 [Anaerohalosphaera sp.]|nr:hypothetical protein [Anaerohalosphaera sp.]
MTTEMKKMVLVVAAFVCVLVVGAYAAHSDYGCDSCHTPHNAEALVGVPLWNGSETMKSFAGKMYTSTSMDAVTAEEPDGASKLCMSCHDGSNGHTYIGTHTKIDYDTGSPIVDDDGNPVNFAPTAWEDLSNSHPISFVYDEQLALDDGGLKNPTEDSGLGGSIADDMLDPAGKVQCTTCHDVHTSGVGENLLRGYDYFHGPNGGALCRVCHEK